MERVETDEFDLIARQIGKPVGAHSHELGSVAGILRQRFGPLVGLVETMLMDDPSFHQAEDALAKLKEGL